MLNPEDLLTIIQKNSEKNNYVIDIGASVGTPSDPCYPFITNPEFNGLCIEGDKNKVVHLIKRVSYKINVYCDYVTPENICNIFEKNSVPLNIDLLKIDIDGYDLEVIRKILQSKYKPIFIIAEINEKIPPPILFEIKYNKQYKWDESHCFGFSLASGKEVFENNGYYIVSLIDMNNILCIRKDKINLLPNVENFPKNINDLYEKQYINNILRPQTFPWNNDVNYWLEIKDKKQLYDEIKSYFTEKNTRSKFINKTKKLDLDFILNY